MINGSKIVNKPCLNNRVGGFFQQSRVMLNIKQLKSIKSIRSIKSVDSCGALCLRLLCCRISESEIVKSLYCVVHSPAFDHFFIQFFQPYFIVVYRLVVVTEVHARAAHEAGVDERVGRVEIRRIDFGHVQ